MKLKNIGYAAFIAATAAALLIGSVGASDAKSKKKMAAPPPPPPGPCFTAEKQVCATRGGMKFTYASACIAVKDGAKVVSDKACPVKKAVKHHKKSGKKKVAKPMKDEKKKM